MCEIVFEAVTPKMKESNSEVEIERRRLISEIEVVRAKLAPYQIEKRRNEFLEREINDLEGQVKQRKMEMEQLQFQLKMMIRQGEDARKSKAAREAKLSKFKRMRQDQLRELVMELNSGELSASSRCQDDGKEIKSEKENTVNGEGSLEDDSTSLPVSSQDLEFQEDRPRIRSSTPVESAQEKRKSLEAEEQPAKKLRKAPVSTDDHEILPEESQDNQSDRGDTAAPDQEVSRPQQTEAPRQERERSNSIDSEKSTSKNSDQSSVVPSNSSDIGESSSESSEEDGSLTDNHSETVNPSCSTDKSDDQNPAKSSKKKKRKYKKLKVGKNHVLVSNRFFDIDFKKEYRRTKSRRLACKRCPLNFCSHQQMIDHLWFVHHGGRYKCPHRCYVGFFRCRQSIWNHIRTKHPDLCKNPEAEAEDKL